MNKNESLIINYSPCIITFLGPVGVGKSTQMNLLSNYLKKNKILTTQTYIKTNHLFTYVILKTLEFFGQTEEIYYQEGFNQNIIKKNLKHRLLPLLNLSELVSTTIKFFFTVVIPYKLGYTILLEEGLLMGIADYEKILPELYKVIPRYFPFFHILLEWCHQQNHLYIIMEAPDNELKERRKTREFRRIETSNFVYLQRTIFNQFEKDNTIRINTNNKSIPRIHKEIVKEAQTKIFEQR